MKKSLAVLLCILLASTAVVTAFAGNTGSSMRVIHAVNSAASDSGLVNTTWVDDSGSAVDMTPKTTSGRVRADVTLPSSYDLRNVDGQNYVTVVKDQGYSGSCWAFATMASLESNYLKNVNTTAPIDLSESHLTWFGCNSYIPVSAYDPTSGDGTTIANPYSNGGNNIYSIFAFARNEGAATEAQFPFDCSSEDKLNAMNKNGIAEASRYVSDYHVSDMIDIANDQTAVKTAIMQYGALYFSYYDDAELSKTDNHHSADWSSYYFDKTKDSKGSAIVANHAVTVVGWNDSYSKTNFKTGVQPSKDGAWLVKNSWGSDWSLYANNYTLGGYMWISYEDVTIGEFTAFVAEKQSYDNTYMYDGNGYDSAMQYDAGVTGGSADLFTAKGSESLKAVSFYTLSVNPTVTYKIDIYTDVPAGATSPIGGYKITAAETTGTLTNSGYHTIPLAHDVALKAGQTFSVVVTISASDGSKVNVPIESDYPDGGLTFNSSPCQSYIFDDTSNGWLDLNKALGYDNACVHALTDSTDPSVKLDADSSSVTVGGTLNLHADVYPADSTLTWTSSDKDIATVDGSGIVTGVSNGSADITASFELNGVTYSDSFTVNVVEAAAVLPTLAITPSSLSLSEGASSLLTAAVSPDTTPAQTLVWSSSDDGIASVDQSGNVTAKSVGSAVITVKSADGTYKAECTVTVTGNKLDPAATTGKVTDNNNNSGNFFTNFWQSIINFFKMIADFFRHLFGIS